MHTASEEWAARVAARNEIEVAKATWQPSLFSARCNPAVRMAQMRTCALSARTGGFSARAPGFSARAGASGKEVK